MAAVKKSISLPEQQFSDARSRWEQLGFTTFSDYVQNLIRADLGYGQMHEGSGAAKPPPAPAKKITSYGKGRARATGRKHKPKDLPGD